MSKLSDVVYRAALGKPGNKGYWVDFITEAKANPDILVNMIKQLLPEGSQVVMKWKPGISEEFSFTASMDDKVTNRVKVIEGVTVTWRFLATESGKGVLDLMVSTMRLNIEAMWLSVFTMQKTALFSDFLHQNSPPPRGDKAHDWGILMGRAISQPKALSDALTLHLGLKLEIYVAVDSDTHHIHIKFVHHPKAPCLLPMIFEMAFDVHELLKPAGMRVFDTALPALMPALESAVKI